MSEARTLAELEHHTELLPGGGKIVVIDTGALIGPEERAMIQALESRSTGGIDHHLNELIARGAKRFIETTYVGYGHKSIGDCGDIVVFIEGVSMLAAKAIQDGKLYNGQEASTRYIPFDKQPFLNPVGNDAGERIVENLRTMYLKAVERMKAALVERYPFEEYHDPSKKDPEAEYHKAISARAFDTTRCLLPAGASTNLAWSGTIRSFGDRLLWLRHHPLDEVRIVAEKLEAALIAVYPSSFSGKRYEESEQYYELAMRDWYYHHDPDCPDFELVKNGTNTQALFDVFDLLNKRPPMTELPKWLGAYGDMQFAFTLDYGSFRDIQRHRAVTQRMPLLTTDLGFESWYLDEMTKALRVQTEYTLADTKSAIEKLGVTPEIAQYYIPMGYQVANHFSGDLPATVYLAELRATRFVHPTLRRRARQMAVVMEETFVPHGLALHIDDEPDRFDVKRGSQDIVLT